MMIDSDKRDSRTRGSIGWDFVILSGKRSFSVINKVEEIRISCECVGGSILEAIPNIRDFSSLSARCWM